MSKNGRITISKYEYLKVGQLFDWADKEHYVKWFTGRSGRHRRTETMLPRLVRKGKLKTKRVGKKIAYIVPRKGRKPHPNIEHGLGSTEGLVRFWRSRMDGLIIPERHFRGFGIVPEWGISYNNGKILLYEFCTADNFFRSGNIQGKMTRYNQYLPSIEAKFGREGIVLFVIDVGEKDVEEYIVKRLPLGDQFFFADYQTFLRQPIGDQLKAPIYIWGGDGEKYPLESKYVESEDA